MPNCARVTIGPGAHPDQSTSIGIAAHIYSAAAGGPRGSGGLSRDELRSPANALWLCENHASQVDKNRGTDYPPELLLSYKAVHEGRVARELGGVFSRFGWIQTLRVISSPLFLNATNIELGKLTLLIGNNDTGKTALCEWLSSVSSARFMRRWQHFKPGRNRVDVQVDYLDPEPHTARVSFLSGSFPRFFLDGVSTAVPTAPIKVIYPEELKFGFGAEQPDDLDLIASALGLDRLEILALCDAVSANGTDNVTRARFQSEEDGYVLRADVKGTYPGLQFRQLSGSEKVRVLMEFAILAANYLSSEYPTVLVLDANIWSLDTKWLSRYGEVLASPTIGFQTIASIPLRDLDMDALQWAGWKVVRLHGEPPDVATSSEIR